MHPPAGNPTETPADGLATEPLRLAVACDAGGLCAWHARIVELVSGMAEVRLVAVLWWTRQSGSVRALAPRRRLSWMARGARALRSVGTPSVLEHVLNITISPSETAGVESLRLDAILWLAASDPRPGVLGHPRFGTWRYRAGQSGASDLVTECADAVFSAAASVLAVLQRVEDGRTLRSGHFRVARHSLAATLDSVCLGVVPWARDVLRGVEDVGSPGEPSKSGQATANAKPAVGALSLLAHLVVRWTLHILRVLFRHDEWGVGCVPGVTARDLVDGEGPLQVEWLSARRTDGYFADPFALPGAANPRHILVEDYHYGSRLGRLTALDLADPAKADPLEGMEDLGHISYPYLIEEADSVYCVPGTPAARGVFLFRATAFPCRWRMEAVLLEGFPGVDATPFRHCGRWWLACGSEDDRPNERLYLFHAEGLRGPWIPHARNPVKTDVRSARPAGTPFHVDGILYRPAQDASRTYGGRIALNRVTALTPTCFAEETVRWLEPSPYGKYAAGMHTLCFAGAKIIVDGKRKVFRAECLRAALAEILFRSRRNGRG